MTTWQEYDFEKAEFVGNPHLDLIGRRLKDGRTVITNDALFPAERLMVGYYGENQTSLTNHQVLEMLAPTIWVFVVDHRDGLDIEAATTEEQAWKFAVGWAREYWAREMGDEEMPEDDTDLVKAYFENVEEWFCIQRTQVIG